MASSNSITEPSPKFQLPTRRSIMAEAKAASPAPEWLSTRDAALSNFQKIVAELMGTYILVFVGCGAALTDRVQRLNMLGMAVVWGAVLMAAIYALGHVSGAHFNPAVSIALAVVRKFSWKEVPMYVLAQVLGSTLASLTLRMLFREQGNIRPIVNQYSDPTSDLEAIVWEFIITFILMFTICGVATDPRANKDLSGVAIGGAVMFNAMIAGPITGASMNPARSLGPALVSGVYKNLWVYIVSPILGAMAAAAVYSVLRVPEPAKPEDTNKSTYNNLNLHADP
uniref:Aquaporin NIP11 n=1 Tax=Populus canadensis TaxID=3690 RepID=A0A7D5C933_POPCA|nr:aquaporin NIP1;1 [Populus x canadensis]